MKDNCGSGILEALFAIVIIGYAIVSVISALAFHEKIKIEEREVKEAGLLNDRWVHFLIKNPNHSGLFVYDAANEEFVELSEEWIPQQVELGESAWKLKYAESGAVEIFTAGKSSGEKWELFLDLDLHLLQEEKND
jgi:hypothetical protein